MKNITYLFGAGASYHACPILNELGDRMLHLSKKLNYGFKFSEGIKKSFADEKEKMVWEIGYIGFKSKEFNTVDTYARKLYLQNEIKELNMLKSAVSAFFTLWRLTDDSDLKKLPQKDRKEKRNFIIDPSVMLIIN